jgi:hypothetical protein
MDLLRVCPGFDTYCCGVCEKCLRTRTALRLLRLHCPNLEPLESVAPLRGLHIDSDRSCTNWTENHRLARASGDRPVERAIARALAGYAARSAARVIDDLLIGGALFKARGRVRHLLRREPPPTEEIRIDAPR